MYGEMSMVVLRYKLPLLLIFALALICIMPSWVPAVGIHDYYGSYYYPSTPYLQEVAFYGLPILSCNRKVL